MDPQNGITDKKLKLSVVEFFQNAIYLRFVTSGVSGQTIRTHWLVMCTLCPIFHDSMQFSGENGHNNRLAHLPLGLAPRSWKS